MDDLIVILRIEEGVGFFKKSHDNIIAVASLSNNQLESDVIQSNSTTTNFNSNLIWETDRIAVKRMKQENLPIRIECYAIDFKSNDQNREFIGYILLPIRSIAVQAPGKAFVGNPHWFKLIGLGPDWKDFRPQLLLYGAITSRDIFQCFEAKRVDINEFTPKLSNKTPRATARKTLEIDVEKLKIPVRKCDEFFEIGNNGINYHDFNLRITINGLKNVDRLLKENDQLNGKFWLEYKILIDDMIDSTAMIPLKKVNESYIAGKVLSLKFRSSYEILDLFFENNFKFNISLVYENLVFGTKVLNFKGLKSEGCYENHVEKIVCDKRGRCELNYSFELDSNDMENKSSKCDNADIKLDETATKIFPKIDVQHGSSSFKKGDKVVDKLDQTPRRIDFSRHRVNGDKIRHTFSLNLILHSIKFNRKPDNGAWQFSLQHHKADTIFTIVNLELSDIISDVIELDNLTLVLYFSSYIDEIFDVIDTEPCILTISGPRKISARAELDSTTLLSRTNSKKLGTVLMDSETGENLIISHLYIHLDDLGINFNSEFKKYPIMKSQPYFDEKFAYNIVEDLEAWKINEKEKFMCHLKQIERNFLSKLAIEWEERKHQQDLQLSNKIDECMKLTEQLEETRLALKERSMGHLHDEQIVHTSRVDLEKKYSIKFNEMEENNRLLQKDYEHKLKLEEIRYKEIEISKNFIDKENSSLRDRISKLEDKITDINTNSFSKEQISSILEDLLESQERQNIEHKSKVFYKEKWAKLLRQMNQMKKEMDCKWMNFDAVSERECYLDDNSERYSTSDDDLIYNDRKILFDKIRKFDL